MAFAASLTHQGLRVIAMSRFGYLRTPMPADASAAAQADAHVCCYFEAETDCNGSAAPFRGPESS